MHEQFQVLHTSLKELRDNINKIGKTFSGNSFVEQFGWNQTALDSNDLSYCIENLINDIEAYDIQDAQDYDSYLNNQAKKIQALNNNIQNHFTAANPAQLVHVVPNILITIMVIHRDLEKTFFTWEKANEKKLLPRHLTKRLQGTESRINSLDLLSENLEEKVNIINSAHEAAESLPTDMEELKRTQKQISELLVTAKETLSDIQLAEKSAKAALQATEELQKQSKKNKEQTDVYVEQCDEALQITTTEGLAAGFDLKAKELSKSILWWVGGLVLALIIGGVFGAFRVSELTSALNSSKLMGLGDGLIQVMLTVFSIGGPLWFAWLATQQISQRFKLSEDYAYKATVAKSYSGFSKQAIRFGEDVEERLFKATLDRLEEMPLRLVKTKDYNSPWHEFIDSEVVREAVKIVPGLKRELNLYAKNTERKMPRNKDAANQTNLGNQNVENS